MKINQFLSIIDGLRSHRGCQIKDTNGGCRKKLCHEEGGQCWWAITIRGGKTFSGISAIHYDIDSDFFSLCDPDGEFLTEILIAEIVAIQEIAKPSASENQPHELTSLRKEVGRLYGIIKDMETSIK